MAPPSEVPPPLAPSVEEAYRRKCIELKKRLNDIEADNDATRLRVQRIERTVKKQRLERAFLLEQLAKRTSTNVEDSEGSPSPPPTPKEKPLRTKRGHRKPSFLTNLGDASAGSAFIQQGLSPSSDAFSHTHPDPIRNSTPQSQPIKRLLPTNSSNGLVTTASPATSQRKLKNGFDVYTSEMRPGLQRDHQNAIADGTFNVDEHLARAWHELSEAEKEDYQTRFNNMKARDEKGGASISAMPRQAVFDAESRGGSTVATAEDEDVEMAEEEPAVGSTFTAVNSTANDPS